MDRLKEVEHKSGKKFNVLNFVTEQAIMRSDASVASGVITDAVFIENRSPNILSSNFLLPKEIGNFVKDPEVLMNRRGISYQITH